MKREKNGYRAVITLVFRPCMGRSRVFTGRSAGHWLHDLNNTQQKHTHTTVKDIEQTHTRTDWKKRRGGRHAHPRGSACHRQCERRHPLPATSTPHSTTPHSAHRAGSRHGAAQRHTHHRRATQLLRVGGRVVRVRVPLGTGAPGRGAAPRAGVREVPGTQSTASSRRRGCSARHTRTHAQAAGGRWGPRGLEGCGRPAAHPPPAAPPNSRF